MTVPLEKPNEYHRGPLFWLSQKMRQSQLLFLTLAPDSKSSLEIAELFVADIFKQILQDGKKACIIINYKINKAQLE